MHDERKSNAEIAAKIPAAAAGGGYIFHSDHSVPPNADCTCPDGYDPVY